MYEELIKRWAEQEGFITFAEDHSSVLRNLAKWLDRNSNGVANNCFNLTQRSSVSQVKQMLCGRFSGFSSVDKKPTHANSPIGGNRNEIVPRHHTEKG